MKRRVVLILLLLIAGAIVNVAVAWVDALSSRGPGLPSLTELPRDETVRLWREYALANWTAPPDYLGFAGAYGVVVTGVGTLDVEYPETSVIVMTDGVPLPSLRRIAWSEDFAVVQERRLTLGSWSLPIDPIWPGFAINTVFYALVLWLLFAAPFALRRRRRIKRGLCPKCAYPLGTNDVCTECGAAIAIKPRRGDGL